MNRLKVAAIVPAAGHGRRLGAIRKKPFVLLGGKPLASYALKALDNCRAIDGIVVAAEPSCVSRLEKVAKRFKIRKLIGVVAGGKTRFESVRNCIKRLGPCSCDIVLIHALVGNAVLRRGAFLILIAQYLAYLFKDFPGF